MFHFSDWNGYGKPDVTVNTTLTKTVLTPYKKQHRQKQPRSRH